MKGLSTKDKLLVFEVKESDKDLSYILVISTIIYLPEVTVLLISGALIIGTALRAKIETISLIVTIIVVVIVFSASKALFITVVLEVKAAFFRVIIVAVFPPASRVLLVRVVLEARCIFLRVIVTAGVSRQLKEVVATNAASIKTIII